MSKVRVVVDSGGCRATLEGLKYMAARGKDQLLKELAALQVRHITQRVRSGLGVNDQPYPKAKKIEHGLGGTTLVQTGNMLGSVRAESHGSTAEVNIGSALEGKKWLWAQDGTKPHDIFPRNKKALAWKHRAAYSSLKSKKQGTKSTAAFARHAHHPGTPPRPAFGISPADAAKLQAHAERFVTNWMKNLRRAS